MNREVREDLRSNHGGLVILFLGLEQEVYKIFFFFFLKNRCFKETPSQLETHQPYKGSRQSVHTRGPVQEPSSNKEAIDPPLPV